MPKFKKMLSVLVSNMFLVSVFTFTPLSNPTKVKAAFTNFINRNVDQLMDGTSQY